MANKIKKSKDPIKTINDAEILAEMREEFFSDSSPRHRMIILDANIDFWINEILKVGIGSDVFRRVDRERKLKCLLDWGIINEDPANDILKIEEIRGLFGHKLSTKKAQRKLLEKLQTLWFYKNFTKFSGQSFKRLREEEKIATICFRICEVLRREYIQLCLDKGLVTKSEVLTKKDILKAIKKI